MIDRFAKSVLERVPPNIKVAIIEKMGFSPRHDPHQPDCPRVTSSGYLCNCVPDGTYWTAPRDVEKHRGETWDERLASARARKSR